MPRIPGWKPPAVDRFTLPNGLRVCVIERDSFPTETVHLLLHCGGHADPPERRGCAALTAEVLDTGTESATALEISASLERHGSSLSIRGGQDATILSLSALHRYLAPSLATVADLLLHPNFPEPELDRLRKRRLSTLAQAKDRPASLAGLSFQRLAYGSLHPYGTDAAGTEASLGTIGRAHLVEFHARHFRPGRATLFLLGRTGRTEAEGLLSDGLGEWSGVAPPDADPPSAPDARPGICVIDRPGSPQSEIRIGAPAMPRRSEEYFPAIIVNRVLGGQFNSRLNANLRERRGLTYGAGSSFGFGKFGGPFVVHTAVETAATGEAIGEIFRELDLMRSEGLTESEMEIAREGLAGGFALMFETPSQIAGVLQNTALYGLPEDYYDSYLDRLWTITIADAARFARARLDRSGMTAVVVGDARALAPQLEGSPFGPVRIATPENLGI